MQVTNIEQGFYKFTNRHGVSGEISRYIGFDRNDIQFEVWYVTTEHVSDEFSSYADARNHAALIEQ
jgi:hypothetical protein